MARATRQAAPPRATTNVPPSGLQEPLKALANLFMGEIFAPPEGFLAALHGLDEAGFFVEVARKSILHQLVGAAALHGGGVGQLCFQFPCDAHFHFYGSFSQEYNERAGVGAGRPLPYGRGSVTFAG